jgi:DNA-binding protein HU-beta
MDKENPPRKSGIRTKEHDMQKPMTKTQLVAALAEQMGSDKKSAGAALDAIAAVVAKEVAAGGAVTLPGLGKVVCRARPERQVRNPATGETVTKPADKQVKFAIAKALKDSVNA